MKVCYFGTYRASYSRNQIMIAGLRAAGVEVVECHVPLWTGIEDRVEVASGKWASWSFVKRLISAYKQLLVKYASLEKNYDVMVLGYPGQLDVFLARLLTWSHGKPLVLDLFMSIYLIALERGLENKSPASIKLLRLLEATACKLPDLLICDTRAYVTWHVKTHALRLQKFKLVPTGVDDRFFRPITVDKPQNDIFHVLYYGTYIPNHGVETIVEAAKLLKAYPNIHFELVGEGPTKAHAQELAAVCNLQNITFTDWIEKEVLPQKIAQADVVLGVFGTTPQSLMTVQNKIYESLAMGKPVISGDSPTMRATFRHNEHLILVERCNARALVEAIMKLQNTPKLRLGLAESSYRKVATEFTIAALGQRLKQHLEETVNQSIK